MDFLTVLKPDGKLIMVGVSPDTLEFNAGGIVMTRKMIAGSLIGGIKASQPIQVLYLALDLLEQESFLLKDVGGRCVIFERCIYFQRLRKIV